MHLLKWAIFVLIIAVIASAARGDDRYPVLDVKLVKHVVIDASGNYSVRKAKAKPWWMKKHKMKHEKVTKPTGKTIINPRAPLQLPVPDLPVFKARWDATYQPEQVGERGPLYLAGLVTRSRDYLVPVIPVEVRELPQIQASAMPVVATIGGATSAALLFSWWMRRRYVLSTLLWRLTNEYINWVERCILFVEHLIGYRQGRRDRHLDGYGERSQQPRLPSWCVQDTRRKARSSRHEAVPPRPEPRHPDNSPLGLWTRGIQAERSSA